MGLGLSLMGLFQVYWKEHGVGGTGNWPDVMMTSLTFKEILSIRCLELKSRKDVCDVLTW